MMKPLYKHLLTAGLLAGFGLGAIAQSAPPPPATGSGPAQMHAHRGDPAQFAERQAKRKEMRQLRTERRLAALKLKLAVSTAQEGAWTAWTTAMKPAPRQRIDRNEIEKMTTPERIDRMRAVRTARTAEMDRRGQATKVFYAALNADQQKVFDGLRFMKGGKHGKRGGQRHQHGHGGHHR